MGKRRGGKTPEIDFVINWVDGADPDWQWEKERYAAAADGDARMERYRDWGLLQYWFRGVEQFAPWVRRIHFVTWGHIPKWLNVDNSKLRIVRHEDYIPKELLPTFNSHTIELYLHKISGLSEQFVYFNDDMYPIRDLEPEDFFHDGLPCDMLAFQPIVANARNPVMSHLFLNNILVLAKYFDKRGNVKKQPAKYFKIGYPPLYFCYNLLELAFPMFTGLYTVHNPYPLCRKTFEEVWEKEGELLYKTCSHRVRSPEDVSPYLIREWQKLSGQFYAKNVSRTFGYFEAKSSNRKLLRTIAGQKKKIICINDASSSIDFANIRREIGQAFEKILPQKSTFEK